MLEPLVDGWEEETSCEIKMQLLTAAVKLFFKRPPEMQVRLAVGGGGGAAVAIRSGTDGGQLRNCGKG